MNPSQPWTHRQASVNGVRLHLVEAGAGPPVLLLHGFPEFWYSWRHQLPALAGAGLHVLAPDLRGYNESDKPAGVRNYRVSVLVEDVAALIEQSGARRAAVVGHDWGGAIAWALAIRRPDLVERLAILNAPHPGAFFRELRDPGQWVRSWYMLFFQVPGLAEWLVRAGNYALLEAMLRNRPVHRDAFSTEDVARYKQALDRPGARTATLNYYRALLRYGRELPQTYPTIAAPTLLIWGVHDPFLGIGLTKDLGRWVPDLRVERIRDASHWVQNEVPDRVNRLLVEFLRPVSPRA